MKQHPQSFTRQEQRFMPLVMDAHRRFADQDPHKAEIVITRAPRTEDGKDDLERTLTDVILVEPVTNDGESYWRGQHGDDTQTFAQGRSVAEWLEQKIRHMCTDDWEVISGEIIEAGEQDNAAGV